MKHAYSAFHLAAVLLLLVSCSQKEALFISKGADPYGFYKEARKAEGMPAHAAALTLQSAQEKVFKTDTLPPEANASTAANLSESTPGPVQPVDYKPAITPGKVAARLAKGPEGNSRSQKTLRQGVQATPEGETEKSKEAGIGLMLSLLAAALILVGIAISSLVPFLLAALAAVFGMIASIAALSEIKKNPGKLAGREKARAGLVISSTLLVVFLVALIGILAWGGAFSGGQ
ncbi:hypothetical protein DXT99_22405 [Pontibacter diazotrophicus]|uniref:DUF4190 domain-containing protein n=1 Tax=Pontibacter diazotrophicus TaxID=1400979 RepID=A0A3D8L5N9_9BACT|nr:hypothetical protein [Pontibacter diazotrophicus]RDV12616.1 hypothetical protein DXT99_22405 [Pontibacter diazotrophicus]